MILASENKKRSVITPFKVMVILLVGLFMCCWCQAEPKEPTISNNAISVTLNTEDATFSISDKRTGHTWRQRSLTKGKIIQSSRSGDGIEMVWHQPGLNMDIKTEILLDNNLSEFTLELTSGGELKWSLRFPHPFVTEAGTYLVVPMNEGISYPVEDKTIRPRKLIAYGGHGICMPFWGVTDGRQGYMAIIETPDDASIRIQRTEGKLYIAPEWDSQKGRFGYARRLRYVFFDEGGLCSGDEISRHRANFVEPP